MLTILVTGGAGFIGSHVCQSLLSAGHDVVCFDNLSTGSMKNIQALAQHKHFSFVKGDCNFIKDLQRIFNKNTFDYIFHYAAVVGVKRTLENPLLVLQDYEGTKNILEISRQKEVKQVIYSSSSEVYGDPPEIPEREDGILNPLQPYAITKLMSENLLEAYYKEYGMSTTSLRFFNVYGPRQNSTPYGFVIGIFIKQALTNQNLTVFSDGLQTRDFVYIQDNISASLKALENSKVKGKVINIATGKETKIIDLAKKIIKLTHTTSAIKFVPQKYYDIRRRHGSIERMKELLNFTPQFSLEQGLQETINWYRKNL